MFEKTRKTIEDYISNYTETQKHKTSPAMIKFNLRYYVSALAELDEAEKKIDEMKDWSKAKWQSIELATKEINKYQAENERLKQLIPIAEDLLTWCIEDDKKYIYKQAINKLKGGE